MALLRAVNLGGRNKVPMAELRARLADAGFGEVRTYIASGNVLFTAAERDAAAVARRVERTVADAFDVTTTAVMRTFAEVRALAEAHPFGDDTSRTYVTFLAEEPDAAAVAGLEELDLGRERLHLAGRDAILHLPDGVGGAQLTAATLEQRLGVAATNRNWRTVAKLAELACSTT